MKKAPANGCNVVAEAPRRMFLARTAAAAVGGAVVTAMPPGAAAPALARVTYPSLRLGSLEELNVNEPKLVTYPDADSPGVLIKLGAAVEGGVGPEGDVVAFSTQCPHKGFPLFYRACSATIRMNAALPRLKCSQRVTCCLT